MARRVSAAVIDPPGLAPLAERWAELAPRPDAVTATRLATLLRRLAGVLTAEPFWPMSARDIGVELLSSGLCGDPVGAAAEDALPATLRLLRRDALGALGVDGPAAADRLAAALDELVTGFARALREDLGAWHAEQPRPRVLSETHYRTVHPQTAADIGVTLDRLVLDLNPDLCRLFGLPAPPATPRPITDFVHPDGLSEVVRAFHELVRGDPYVVRMEIRFVRPDGLVLVTRVEASLVRDDAGSPTHVLAVVEDQSERARLRMRLQRAAYHDTLTQLPNRAFTEQWVEHLFADGRNRMVGLLALDLDGLTAVNDGFGRRAGDQLLLAVAARLQLASGDRMVSRTGGDEFAVLLPDPAGIAEVCAVADRVLEAFAAPFLVDGRSLMMSASVGVAAAPTADAVPSELIRAADVALTWAKTHGGGRRVVFDPQRDAGESARFALLTGLPGAIERGELRLAYQPLVGLADGELRGVEALVRWQHPEQGLLGPGRFIELAERSGAIVPLGEWVLRTACAHAAAWRAEFGAAAPYVSVNVSPVQLVTTDWARVVAAVLAEHGLPPDRLQLEITEQAVLADEAAALATLTALRDSGVRLALDDFGTGYSGLTWLRRLPVHALKIDGSFIDGLRHPVADEVDAAIVAALVGMAHALGLEVTAEWVETGVQAERLAALGCDVGQGHWFGDAGPGEWAGALLRRNV